MLRRLINIEALIHSLKTFIACLIGILFTYVISFPSDQWIVITIIVVMCAQLYVGSVIQKSYLRFAGTLFGCLFAITALITLGDNRLAVATTVGISAFVFSFISLKWENLSYAGTLGAVTTAIIMLGQTPTIAFAAERFLEISIGLLIATLVSQFILPIHARDHLRRSQIATLEKMRDYYHESMIKTANSNENLNYIELDEDIVKGLLKQRQLAIESKREPLGTTFDQENFLQTIYCEKDLLRATTFMHLAFKKILEAKPDFVNLISFNEFNKTTLNAFNAIINALENEKEKISITLPNIKNLAADCEKNLRDSQQLLYTEGFIYCAELLCSNLAKLALLTGARAPFLPPI